MKPPAEQQPLPQDNVRPADLTTEHTTAPHQTKRRIGTSDLYVHPAGLGCMSLGTDEQHATRIIDAALDLGVNYFDTADLYDDGRNEEILGAALRGRRSQVILATKVGNKRIPGQTALSWDASKSYILSAVRASLRRLQTDYIDLYQLHGGMITDNIDETIEAFEQLQQEGLIRYYGISSIRPNVIRAYVQRSHLVSVMMQYSLLDRRPEEEILPLLADRNIAVIPRGALAQGLLTEQGLSRYTVRANKTYLGYTAEDLRSTLEQLTDYAAAVGTSLTELAHHYVLHPSTVSVNVSGASSVAQLEQNVRYANSTPLTDAQLTALKALTVAGQYDAHR
jgi:aryl-alcohol dehydrogenase-like predicted oxidoreductase